MQQCDELIEMTPENALKQNTIFRNVYVYPAEAKLEWLTTLSVSLSGSQLSLLGSACEEQQVCALSSKRLQRSL